MDERIGTCSQCGGPVVMPSMMVHPIPHCEHCGATVKNPHGPVIKTVPKREHMDYSWWTALQDFE